MHRRQLSEFSLRSGVVPAGDLVRAATSNGAKLMRMEEEFGQVKAGLSADLIIVDGNPLDDIAVLTTPDTHLKLVMARGAITRAAL